MSGHQIVEREKTIDGARYRCVPLRGDEMLDVFVLVLRVCAPAAHEDVIAAALTGNTPSASQLSGSLSDVLRSLNAADVQVLRKRLSSVTEVSADGGRTWHPLDHVFGEHFAGRLPALLQWLLHAFSVSFPLFLSAFAPSPSASSSPTATDSPSPNTSRGSSGGQ